MGYSTIRTKHDVGDIVYFLDSESDSVQRGVVVGIEARRCTQPGTSPAWQVFYTVAHKFAADPPARPSLILECDLHSDAGGAFPPVTMDEKAVA